MAWISQRKKKTSRKQQENSRKKKNKKQRKVPLCSNSNIKRLKMINILNWSFHCVFQNLLDILGLGHLAARNSRRSGFGIKQQISVHSIKSSVSSVQCCRLITPCHCFTAFQWFYDTFYQRQTKFFQRILSNIKHKHFFFVFARQIELSW